MPGTTTYNLVLFSYIHEVYLIHSQIDVIYKDFAKEFDHVDHSKSIKVLVSVGFSDPLLFYLVDRKKWISIHGISSSYFFPSYGVPQNVVLLPLLFSSSSNSTNLVLVYAKFLMFADDMKIFLCIDLPNNCLILQNDLS